MTNEDNKLILSRNLRAYMSRDRLNTKQLSEMMRLPYTTVHSWITADNYPRIDSIEAMADIFDIKMSDLIEEKPLRHRADENTKVVMDALPTMTDSQRKLMADLARQMTQESIDNQ